MTPERCVALRCFVALLYAQKRYGQFSPGGATKVICNEVRATNTMRTFNLTGKKTGWEGCSPQKLLVPCTHIGPITHWPTLKKQFVNYQHLFGKWRQHYSEWINTACSVLNVAMYEICTKSLYLFWLSMERTVPTNRSIVGLFSVWYRNAWSSLWNEMQQSASQANPYCAPHNLWWNKC